MKSENLRAPACRQPGGHFLLVVLTAFALPNGPVACPAQETAGYLTDAAGRTRFPIGFYELPKEEADLKAMADAGVNIVHCGNREDLDRADKAGIMGWVSLGVQAGASDSLRQRILNLRDHPALAVWEGPDEIVWNFTAYSFLEKSAGFTREDWNRQTPKAIAYAESQARKIMPGIREGVALVRQLDTRKLPFWINEAADSDMKYVRQYMDATDITGCDYYAVRSTGTDLQGIGRLVDRWNAIGRGRPVWMVLQAFSWHSIKPERDRLYPAFAESRFMAYDAIAHGARGLFYWGSTQIEDPAFRSSLYALTDELSRIESFLAGVEHPEIRSHVVDDLFDPPQSRGVRTVLRRHGADYLLLVVNEDPHRHLGVEITGLEALDGRRLECLYENEAVHVERGGFVTRLQGFEVKVFATRPGLESSRLDDREYPPSR